MDIKWAITLIVVLSAVVIFASLRQDRIKNVMTMNMTGGGHHGGRSGRSSRSGHRGHRGHRGHSGRSSGHRGYYGQRNYWKPLRPGRTHIRYIERPDTRYYGDSWGWGYRGYPSWFNWNYWWPGYDQCIDYATDRCIGSIDYQSCFNTEYNNCPIA